MTKKKTINREINMDIMQGRNVLKNTTESNVSSSFIVRGNLDSKINE